MKQTGVVLACGGKAAPQTGSRWHGLCAGEKSRPYGHRTASCPGSPDGKASVWKSSGWCAEPCRDAALRIDGKAIAREKGELQWTGYGISGIAVFQLSSQAVRALQKKKKVEAEIDLLPDFTENELTERVRDREGTYEEILGGFYHVKVLKALLKEAKAAAGGKKQFRKNRLSDKDVQTSAAAPYRFQIL